MLEHLRVLAFMIDPGVNAGVFRFVLHGKG